MRLIASEPRESYRGTERKFLDTRSEMQEWLGTPSPYIRIHARGGHAGATQARVYLRTADGDRPQAATSAGGAPSECSTHDEDEAPQSTATLRDRRFSSPFSISPERRRGIHLPVPDSEIRPTEQDLEVRVSRYSRCVRIAEGGPWGQVETTKEMTRCVSPRTEETSFENESAQSFPRDTRTSVGGREGNPMTSTDYLSVRGIDATAIRTKTFQLPEHHGIEGIRSVELVRDAKSAFARALLCANEDNEACVNGELTTAIARWRPCTGEDTCFFHPPAPRRNHRYVEETSREIEDQSPLRRGTNADVSTCEQRGPRTEKTEPDLVSLAFRDRLVVLSFFRCFFTVDRIPARVRKRISYTDGPETRVKYRERERAREKSFPERNKHSDRVPPQKSINCTSLFQFRAPREAEIERARSLHSRRSFFARKS
ncbi:hypothetical protein DBV15_07066 [Temnothorax longispinosus]|uniref:Uncharacterized protein n=1 Tax=Temnothorax longispinosus TaxID=300112 RepID=A0A4S2KGE3_9HYME|nr:hypothetical protein DBV15_07066 [Temnothorax longispinosus]